MPKRKMNRTMRAMGKGKHRRDVAVRSMTSGVKSGATSIANSTINRKMKRGRRGNKLERSKALRSMMGSMASGMSSVGKMAYDTSMPIIEEAGRSVGKSVSKFVSENRVPRLSNNSAWTDLKGGLTEGLRNIGLLEDDGNISPAIYFQSVEKFLDTHKDVQITPSDIRNVTTKLKNMDPDDEGDIRTEKMEGIFKKGITHDSIIAALEYEFRKKINSSDDMDIEPEPEPGQGFQSAKEKTSIRNKYNKIVALGQSIETLINGRNTYKPNRPEYKQLQSAIDDQYKILKAEAITQQEKQVLANIDGKLRQSPSMATKKKKSKRRKGKKTGRKRTGRR